jgi:hypothetical protein
VVKGNVKDVIAQVSSELKKKGVTIHGDEKNGVLTHENFKGSYTTEGEHKITMTITDSPW